MGSTEDLKTDLITVGCKFLGDPKTKSDSFLLEYAVREFQRYARMTAVAKELTDAASAGKPYPERLAAATNSADGIYGGPVDGDISNALMLKSLAFWKAQNFRIPVVVSLWRGGVLDLKNEFDQNVWFPFRPPKRRQGQKAKQKLELKVTDFTGRYNRPLADSADGERYVPIGGLTRVKGSSAAKQAPVQKDDDWFGAVTSGSETVTFQAFTGQVASPGNASTQATYRVIFAATEPEVHHRFNGLNGWDDAVLSSGLMQWSVGAINKKRPEALDASARIAKGELPAFMALLKLQGTGTGSIFVALMGELGMDVVKDWGTIDQNGGLFNRKSRKYETSFVELRPQAADDDEVDAKHANLLRGLHTFYRFYAAATDSTAYQQAMWTMCRLRLREMMDTPWPQAGKPGDKTPQWKTGPATSVPATIGQVFRSERSLAVLLRWSIKKPSHIVLSSSVASPVRAAFNEACRMGGSLFDGYVQDWKEPAGTAKGISTLEAVLTAALVWQVQRTRFAQEVATHLTDVLGAKTELAQSMLTATRDFAGDFDGLPAKPKLQIVSGS